MIFGIEKLKGLANPQFGKNVDATVGGAVGEDDEVMRRMVCDCDVRGDYMSLRHLSPAITVGAKVHDEIFAWDRLLAWPERS